MALARRSSAPSSATPTLHVFISYATEDANLAQAINLELKTVFTQLIKTTLDSNIKLGAKWPPELEEALSRADVLLIISSGRAKPSHSYTGFEVGFFRASMLAKPTMTHIDREQRLIIPIGVEKIPDTVSDIEGLNLAADMRPFLMDSDRQKFLQSLQSDTARNPFMKLFVRLKGLVQRIHEFDETEMEILLSKAKESAIRLYTIFLKDFRTASIRKPSLNEKSSFVCPPMPALSPWVSCPRKRSSNSLVETSRYSTSVRRQGEFPGLISFSKSRAATPRRRGLTSSNPRPSWRNVASSGRIDVCSLLRTGRAFSGCLSRGALFSTTELPSFKLMS